MYLGAGAYRGVITGTAGRSTRAPAAPMPYPVPPENHIRA
jgi:hypothetical protein